MSLTITFYQVGKAAIGSLGIVIDANIYENTGLGDRQYSRLSSSVILSMPGDEARKLTT